MRVPAPQTSGTTSLLRARYPLLLHMTPENNSIYRAHGKEGQGTHWNLRKERFFGAASAILVCSVRRLMKAREQKSLVDWI
jgi:hypothetical protein